VYRPLLWQNGRSKAMGIATFTMVSILSYNHDINTYVILSVSLVDGYNLPMSITTSTNCPSASCAVDLGPSCPDPLKGPFDSTGFPVGCKSACAANLDGNPTDSANCCSGSHDTAATCPSSQVAFYSYFSMFYFFPSICVLAGMAANSDVFIRGKLSECICICF
jgi:hypothetical protein